jgi:hypothetical protein
MVRPDRDDLIAFLNELPEIEGDAVADLVVARVPCNQGLADHPTVQVGASACGHEVGFLGILNGYCGTIDAGAHVGYGPITAQMEDGRIVRFERTDEK